MSGTTERRYIEYIGRLDEHFVDSVEVVGGRYLAPRTPGMSAELRPEAIADHTEASGTVWAEEATV